MGASGISIWQLLIVLLIVVLIFGTKRLKNLGGDLGGAIKSFRKGMTEAEKAESELSNIGDELSGSTEEESSNTEDDDKSVGQQERTLRSKAEDLAINIVAVYREDEAVA